LQSQGTGLYFPRLEKASSQMRIGLYCYEYAPEYRVGGRRWRLFADRLCAEGHDLLLRAKSPKSVTAPARPAPFANATWLPLPTQPRYPWLDNWFDQFTWRWRLGAIWSQATMKGNTLEEVRFLATTVRRIVREDLAKEQLHWIIVSLPPFHWAKVIAEEVRIHNARHPDRQRVRLMFDYRDAWSENALLLPELNAARRAVESRNEQAALQQADAVVCVNEQDLAVRQALWRRGGGQAKRAPHFAVIPNGVHLPSAPPKHLSAADKHTLSMLFAGWIYPPGQPIFTRFISALLDAWMQRHPSGNVRLCVAGTWPGALLQTLREMPDLHLDELGYITHDEVQSHLKTVDFAVSFVSDEVGHAVNTKILEAASHGTPLAVLTNEGAVSAFVRENGLGVVLPHNLSSGVTDLIDWKTQQRTTGPWTSLQGRHGLAANSDKLLDLLRQGS